MSIKFTSAQLDPQTAITGAGCRLIIGVEQSGGILKDSGSITLLDRNGASLSPSDGQEYALSYAGDQADTAIGGLLLWQTE